MRHHNFGKMRNTPIHATCRCGCGRAFVHYAAGRPRLYWGDHRLVTVRANEKKKRRLNTPDGYRDSILAGLGT